MASSAFEAKASIFEKAAQKRRDEYAAILKRDSDEYTENPYLLHEELAAVMLRDCTIERHNDVLDKVIAKIDELEDRFKNVRVTDTHARANQGAQFVRHLRNMLVLARVIAQGARNRDESRGAHFKPEFKARDDAGWLRTTMAMYEGFGARSGVRYVRALDYAIAGKSIHATDEVDISLVKPRARKYETAGAASAGAAGEGARSAAKTAATSPAE
jgi:succinate dehydrogenase / fumarate reductase flavoprotein subunit